MDNQDNWSLRDPLPRLRHKVASESLQKYVKAVHTAVHTLPTPH